MIFKEIDPFELILSENELSSRLKCPSRHLPDEFFKYIEELKSHSSPAFCAVRKPVRFDIDGKIAIGGITVASCALKTLLYGCSETVILCATLGFGAERIQRRYSVLSASAHFMIDAAADAMIEALCDRAEEIIFESEEHTGRFSPGYADLPLEFVKSIVNLTEAERLLGVRLNDCFLASPSKTVTAIIGVKGEI